MFSEIHKVESAYDAADSFDDVLLQADGYMEEVIVPQFCDDRLDCAQHSDV